MSSLSPEEEKRKKAIFDTMSPRQQKYVLKKGYGNWDPFMEPKDPLDIRRGLSKKTAGELAQEFLKTCDPAKINTTYAQGVWEICVGLISDNDRYQGMYEFAIWYKNLIKKGD